MDEGLQGCIFISKFYEILSEYHRQQCVSVIQRIFHYYTVLCVTLIMQVTLSFIVCRPQYAELYMYIIHIKGQNKKKKAHL